MTIFFTAAFLVLALLAANVPWMSGRFFIFLSPPGGTKRFWMEFLEWLVFYCLMGLVAFGLEMKVMGGLHTQDWEFYAITLCLFVVFAIPGFVYRHTLRQHLK